MQTQDDRRRGHLSTRRAPPAARGAVAGQTVGELATERDVVSASTRCAEIDEWFRGDVARRSLVVAERDVPVLVNRSAFYEALAGRLGYGWSLFHDAPLGKLLERVVPGPALAAGTSLADAGLALLSGGQVDSDQDLMVVYGDGRVGTLAVHIALAELVKVHADQVALLETSERRFRSLVQNSFDGLVLLDAEGRVLSVGPSTEQVSDTPAASVVGRQLASLVHPSDRHALERLVATSVASPAVDLGGHFRQRRLGGEWGWFELRVRNLLDDPAVSGVVVNYRDVTESKRLEERLRHEALHDSLTGLPNRSHIVERGAALLRDADPGSPPAVLFVDLDAFKDVNDTLGHAAGDELLRAVAGRLRAAVRSSDVVGRLGGDEFVVLVEGRQGASPAEVAARILEVIAAPFAVRGKAHTITTSVGIAAGGEPGVTIELLLQRADIALYEAKELGRDRAVVFAPEMHRRIEGRLAIEAELANALHHGHFHLLYQPCFDIATLRPRGMEALLRWERPGHGTVRPDEFIPVLEATGAIVEVGRWVLNEACSQAARWHAAGFGVDVSVNLSAVQLDDARLVDDVAAALDASAVTPARVVIEVTESVLVRDVDAASARLAALRALGLRVAIDDFGTGYSSLAYLRRFAADVLKIDKSFVAGLGEAGRSAALLRTLVQLGRDLSMETVAEGVEDRSQLELLRAEGCEKVQGFLLGRPMPPEEATALLAADEELSA